MRLIAILLATVSAVAANDMSAASKTAGVPILVELFTSEGCSSCPPADAWLQQLDSSQPVPGARLIVLSEHVDYWDHDGWKDPFSSPALTDRQEAYGRAFGLASVYTPQIIVDGKSELQPNNSQQVDQVFRTATSTPTIPVGISSVTTKGTGMVEAHLEIDGVTLKRDSDIYLALALDHAESQVLRGENGGKRLPYVAVVRTLKKVGRLQKGKKFDQDVEVKLDRDLDEANLRLVVFVQNSGPGEVLGAASEMLPARASPK